MTNVEKAVEKIVEMFRETDADSASEVPVNVEDGEAIAEALRQRGFVVTTQPRYSDVERKHHVRTSLNIRRRVKSDDDTDKTRTEAK